MLNVARNIIRRGESMRVDITAEGDFKDTINWLNKAAKTAPVMSLKQIGESGVRALKAGTPRGKTGQTASGWKYRITSDRRGSSVDFYNTSHPESQVNVAKLIQLGHGTKNGGYVPPRDYINPALRNIFDTAGDKIAKEVFK